MWRVHVEGSCGGIMSRDHVGPMWRDHGRAMWMDHEGYLEGM